MTQPREFTAGFLFCGLGAGALGFLQGEGRLGADRGRFRSLGGIDNDAHACADFELLTSSPAWCTDIAAVTPEALRAKWGERRPDAIFTSPPCKGFSGLLSKARAAEDKYQLLNQLVFQGLFLVCETWAEPPPLIVLENVPKIQTRGAELLLKARQLLRQYGYVFHEATHDCGEVGGLAQHRRRYLLVARQPKAVTAYVYQPPKQRVRGCGEVLEALPMPNDVDAGVLHRLPRISALNWLRLALIPAGGDWRDLPKAPTLQLDDVAVSKLSLGQTGAGAATFKERPGLFGVNGWEEPMPTITGRATVSGGTTVAAVADPRLFTPVPEGHQRRSIHARYDVRPWEEPARAVTGPGVNGGYGVADPRSHVPPAMTCTDALASLEALSETDVPRTIISADGAWHRPLTALEFAALQGIPTTVQGRALQLSGKSASGWRERIGNAVPVQAARAIADSLLTALVATAVGGWMLGGTGIWVRRRDGWAAESPTMYAASGVPIAEQP